MEDHSQISDENSDEKIDPSNFSYQQFFQDLTSIKRVSEKVERKPRK